MDAALAWLRPVLALMALRVAGGAVGPARAPEAAPRPPPTEQPPAPQGERPTPPVTPVAPPVASANAAEAPPGPPPQRLVLLLHGYTSGSGELAGLAELELRHYGLVSRADGRMDLHFAAPGLHLGRGRQSWSLSLAPRYRLAWGAAGAQSHWAGVAGLRYSHSPTLE